MLKNAVFLAGLASTALAASQVDSSAFANGGNQAAQISQPLFFFAAGSCYPQDGEVNGQQTNGHDTTLCTVDKLADNCETQIPWQGSSQAKGPQVTTYFSIDYCSGDNSWRITYNLYYDHDSGHKSDWEWVSVVWNQDSSDHTWFTKSIIMEQDGDHVWYDWGDLDSFWDDSDMLVNGKGKSANHAKIYVEKWHHAMRPDPFDENKSNCANAGQWQYRQNDWYMFDLENGNLASIDRIDPGWDYGKATNPHDTSKGICNTAYTKGGWA